MEDPGQDRIVSLVASENSHLNSQHVRISITAMCYQRFYMVNMASYKFTLYRYLTEAGLE